MVDYIPAGSQMDREASWSHIPLSRFDDAIKDIPALAREALYVPTYTGSTKITLGIGKKGRMGLGWSFLVISDSRR